MADLTHSNVLSLIDLAEYVNATDYLVVGADIDVRTMLAGVVRISHAYLEAIANDPGVKYIIQTSHQQGLVVWRTIAERVASVVACDTQTLDDAAASGQKVIPLGATTNLAQGDEIYVRDDDGVNGSEFAKIATISAGVSITVADNLQHSFVATNDKVYNDVCHWTIDLPNLSGVGYIRVLIENFDATGANWVSIG